MAEIYSELPSPELDELTDQTEAILKGSPVFGLHSTLHPYQRTSVASMLLKESPSRSIPDPAYIQVSGVGVNEKVFYLQPATLEILQDCPRTSTVRGGILCEELGKAYPPFPPRLCTHWTRYRKNGDDSSIDTLDGRPAPCPP